MHRNDSYYTSEDAAVAAHQNIKERDYWLGQLAGELEKTCFPYDFKGAENRPPLQETLAFKCSPELAAGLLKLSSQSDVRLHMILLTGMVCLLYRYTGDHDILVGTPVLKQAVEAEFINTVLTLRNQVSAGMSFKELLIRLRRTMTEATENQNYPLETLLYKLNIPRQADDFPLFDVAVLLESIHTRSYLDHIPVNMIWSFRRRGRELDGTLEYNARLFRRASVERFTGHYLNLLQEALRQIQLPLPEINILSPPERAQILFEFNNRRQEYGEDESVCAAVEKQSEASPHRVALVFADRAVTYGELNKRANRLAHFLNQRGMTANSPAVLLCRRSPDMAAAVLAVWKAGGAYIPLDVDYPLDRVRLVLADAAAHFLLTESAVVGDEDESHLKTGEILDICAAAGVRQVVFLDRFEGAARACRLFRIFRLSRLLGSGTVPLYDEWKQPVDLLRRFISRLPVEPGTGVGVMLEHPLYFMITLLALEANALPFTFIDPALPLAKQCRLLEDSSISTVFSRSPFLDQLDQLLWESKVCRRYVLLDDYDPRQSKKETFIRELFDFVAQEEPVAEINEYGWRNSYNYENFSLPEMREYIDNLKAKLGPYLNRDSRLLEIGCGHGIMLFELAPSVGFYLATDLAPLIMEKNEGKLRQGGLDRVVLKTAAASEIDTLGEGDFDVVICSSVIHFFPNTLYLEDMIKKAIGLLKRRGVIYLDDIMDLRKKQQLVQSILDYRRLHPGARVKTNWDSELFIDIDFFHDLQQKYPQIVEWQCSGKLGKIENELTRFRFDVMLKIDKDIPTAQGPPACFKNRYTAGDIAAYVKAPFRLPAAASPIPAVGDVDDITAFEAGSDRSPAPRPRPSDACYAIYTSGSTGKPKGAVVEHRGMTNHIRAKIRDLSISAGSVVAQNASQTFDISVWQFFASLTVGGKVVISSPEMVLDPTALIRRLMADGVTILEVVPSYLTVLLDCLDDGENRLDTLTYLLVTGETLKPGLVDRWFARFPGIKMVNAYGPTEAADDITHQVLTGPVDTVSVPIGTALPNLNVYIVDRHHNLNPIGVRGEICVSGLGVGRGYLNNPEATNRVFGQDPFDPDRGQRFYRTGDLGRFAADGTIEFLGRQDEQVKIRGFRIELAEIENRLARHGQVKEAAVVTGSDEQGEPYLCAYLTADGVLDLREIKAYLEGKLPDYMVPAYFVQLAEIPLNENGKIDRRALSRQQPGKRAAAALDPARVSALAFVPPSGELEQKMAEIWSQVLRVDKNSISVDANFFEYGGHSLKAVILTSRLHKMLNVKVPLAEIFKTPTIRGLARYVAAAGHEDHAPLRCAEEKAYYPLSSSQKRLYILQQIDSALVNYNIPVMVTLEGDLERQKLESAFAGLIRRHESFRTSFRVVGLEPVQIIHEAVDFEIEYYGPGAGEPEDIVRGFIRPFDLSRAPLLRVGLIAEGGKYVLAVDMHHVVSDGISMGIFIKEAMALYSGEELPGLAYRYRDFSEWQNRTAETSAIKRQQAYWLAQFAGTIPLLKLPTDYPRPAVQSYEGGCVTVEIGEAETRGLKALAVEQDASLYMVLLALFNVLFSKLSRQPDIVIGTPVAGRRHSDLEYIIGMFINTLALRNYPRREQLFREFLRQVRQRTLEAFENQDYQFEDLVNALSLERDAGRNPLFDVLFVFQNIDVLPGTIPEVQLPGLRLTPFAYNSTISRYDLGFAGQERQGRLILSCEYCTRLFKPETVQRFMDYFKEITRAVLEENDILLQDIRISHDLYDRELDIPQIDFDF